ncbi:non-phosphorylative glyceraldehyde 3-phosphate dehydrogenase TadD [Gordonia sp. OPL2]|uniref:non-phosphorylative glyceraldehyde 3-phosphate dehydrogenase TadD n=1 Tax=Gordonia sp. OPL2 TaxID=2486274 RepID=UPI001655DBCD|nr:non-phosphorylative glyceraldehyde 3-phosphate dehydrogenase TadD [Gordonia sp. OPL2]ROZ88021.1 non-phosphorylative glyceraldehyde 3-phosphate dehydrogenase TadD [Gordonia sp. OPL2]
MSTSTEVVLDSAPGLTIDGKIVSTSARRAVINPATEQVLAEVPDATVEHLEQAVSAARRAAKGWSAKDLAERQQITLSFVDKVRENIDELARLVTLEQGKPLDKAAGEIDSGLRALTRYASLDIPVEVIRDTNDELVEIHRVPVGVVGGITAWNYPLLLALWKIGPSLVTGSPVIIKPSPLTPVATLRLGELAQEVLPPGVVQVLSGGDSLGKAISTHPGINKISFTGSERAGTSIMSAAGPTLKRLTLELGGNDAGIVLDDVDVQAIASGLYWGGLSNCGQVCAGLKRLYVPRRLADDVADALTAIAATVTVGNGLHDGVMMGPIQNEVQYRKVKGYVDDAVQRGADVYFRGEIPDGPGYFHPVTLVRGLADDVPLASEEQFGPVLPLLTYDDIDDVVARANNSPLGLGASVWSSDESRARGVADRLEAGSVWINNHPVLTSDVPFGGVKQSGLGVEQSIYGVLAYTDIKVIRATRG